MKGENVMSEIEIEKFYNYLKATGYIFEVEEVKGGKYSKLIKELEGSFNTSIEHYYIIDKKWGTECRLYFYEYENLPPYIKGKKVSSYNYGGAGGTSSQYNYRINDNNLLLKMVEKGLLRVGEYCV